MMKLLLCNIILLLIITIINYLVFNIMNDNRIMIFSHVIFLSIMKIKHIDNPWNNTLLQCVDNRKR